ncbi:alpha/beta fold hydrolase [Myroides injenensis]|uniref:alpha/beta fold hydrolase n=1 Tax=Myroides injenensis TaxID=1183151 RepID=UPI00028912A0|nr:alpha/beta hydrolase [Myroides injenensis]
MNYNRLICLKRLVIGLALGAFLFTDISYGQNISINKEITNTYSFEDNTSLHLVDIGDGGLAVRYKKGVGTPIVFVHGSWDDHHSWEEVANYVATELKNPIILYDRRGHSASTPDKEQGTISQDVNDALLLIKQLGFEKAHFIGHSYGANIVVELANQYPAVTESIVLYEPPIFGLLKNNEEYKVVGKEVKDAMASAKEMLEQGDIELGTIHFIEDVAFGKGSWKNIFDDRARSTMLASYRTWVDQANDPERLNIKPAKLKDFTGHITAIKGSESIPVYPGVIDELYKIDNRINVQTVQGAGHGGLVSHPQETANIIVKHFENL